MKAYTIRIEALVIADSIIESSTPEQVLDMLIDNTDTMTATIVPMVCGDAKVSEPAPRRSIVSEPQTIHIPSNVPSDASSDWNLRVLEHQEPCVPDSL